MGHPLWPLFDLRVRTGDLELRLPADDDLVELAQIAKAGIHPPDETPFAVPWTDVPSPQFERSFLQFHWSSRAAESNGFARLAPRGTVRELRRYRLTADGWRSRPRGHVEVDGLEGCMELFGAELSTRRD